MQRRHFRVVHGSLTEGQETLLINASNTNANLGTGVSGAIRAACGPGYQAMLHRALQERFGGTMKPGKVFITDAGTHSTARFVAHVAVMDYREGFTGRSYPDLELLKDAYAHTWEAIEGLEEDNISVAVVALGAGTGQIGLRTSVETACETFKRHIAGLRRSKIGDLVFYGHALHEYIATLAVVSEHFEVDLDALPAEIRQSLSHWRT